GLSSIPNDRVVFETSSTSCTRRPSLISCCVSRTVQPTGEASTSNASCGRWQREERRPALRPGVFHVLSTEQWRRGPESNRPTRICNPVHNRFATAPSSSSRRTDVRRRRLDEKGKPRLPFLLSGAGEESRTLDLNLGKVALYQLRYSLIPDRRVS